MALPESDRKKITILTDCMSPVSKQYSHNRNLKFWTSISE